MAGSTDIFELSKQSFKKYEKTTEKEKLSVEQKRKISNGIQQIEGTDGYNYIKSFWEKEFKLSLDALGKINAIDNPGLTTKLQERVDLSRRFLYHLSVHELKS